jgi:peptidyl-prolyl cis-trans isomerase B (cyclophilin B)
MTTFSPDSRAILRTSMGPMTIEFLHRQAPRTCEHFVRLVRRGFYDGLTFHRIIKGFMVQGGCPKGDGTGGPGQTIRAEFNETPHVKGVVSMARGNDPHSAGSQFFIVQGDARYLDSRYTAFARVVEGLDVLDRIASVPVEENRFRERSVPREPIFINGIDLEGIEFDANDQPDAGRPPQGQGNGGGGQQRETRDQQREPRDQPRGETRDPREQPRGETRDQREQPRETRDQPRDQPRGETRDPRDQQRGEPRDQRDQQREPRDQARDTRDQSREPRDQQRDTRDPSREVREPQREARDPRESGDALDDDEGSAAAAFLAESRAGKGRAGRVEEPSGHADEERGDEPDDDRDGADKDGDGEAPSPGAEGGASGAAPTRKPRSRRPRRRKTKE